MRESKPPILRAEDLPDVLTVPQVAAFLQISRTKAYDLCYAEGFPAIRMRRTVRVPKAALLRWLDQAGHPAPER
jgi:excisionase family DNA binding protein